MRVTLCVAIAMLPIVWGCSRPSSAFRKVESNTVADAAALKVYKTPEGIVYDIERVGTVKTDDMPMNSDFKMADKDLGKYAGDTLCAMDQGRDGTPRTRCDVYVQPDKNGTLIGYTAVTQDKDGVSFQTTATLNEKKAPAGSAGCEFDGKLYTSGIRAGLPLLRMPARILTLNSCIRPGRRSLITG